MAGTIIDQWFAAASVGENYKTMHVWDGDGNAARVFELNFQGGYINQADVKSFMVNKTTQARTDLTVRFTGTNTVTLSQAVPATHRVTIYRDTNKTAPLASFADGAIITAMNLDRNAKQAVFAVAEMVDRFDSVTATAQDAIATAYSALDKSNTAINTANAATTTANGAKTAAAGAVADAKAAVQTANTATSTANAAKATADGIDAKVNQAVATSNAANSTAGQAKATAEGIDAKATQAQSDAAKAKTDAASALSTANGVDAKASTALSNSATALSRSQQAIDAVNASAGNFDKIWATVSSISGADVVWKGSHWFKGIELLGDTPFVDFHYGNNGADFTHRIIADSSTRLVVSSALRVNGDLATNKTLSSDGDLLVKGNTQVSGTTNLVDVTTRKVTANGNTVLGSPGPSSQGIYFGWNESNKNGEGNINVNRGGGTGGLTMRFVNGANTVQEGSVTFTQQGGLQLGADLTARDISASRNANVGGTLYSGALVSNNQVYAGGAGGAQLAPDGNVLGSQWGGWLGNWVRSRDNMWQLAGGRIKGWDGVGNGYITLTVDNAQYGMNINPSDARLKDNVELASPEEALEDINRFILTEFDLKMFANSDPVHQKYGFIAQQVEDIIPGVINQIEGGYKQVDLLPLVSALIGSVQALSAKVKALESKE